jgi:hypothetical protein
MASTSFVIATWLAAPPRNVQAISLANAKTIADIISASITAFAVVVGGIWAYFKFAKGRTYRMRTQVDLSGQWEVIDGRHFLQARVAVKNIGASKVRLIQKGSGLRVSVLHSEQPGPPASVKWRSLRVFGILTEHEWIEPEETISDEFLLNLGEGGPISALFEARLVLGRRWPRKNVATFARRVISGDSTTATPTADAEAVAGEKGSE